MKKKSQSNTQKTLTCAHDNLHQLDGALVSPNQGGAANWPPPTFSPQTGLFYVNATRAWSVYYIYDPGDNPMGWGGTDRGGYGEAN